MSRQHPIALNTFDNRDFDRGANRLLELCWRLTKLFFFQVHCPLPSRLRCFLLRRFGAKIGRGVIIRSGTNISHPWRLTVGNYCWIGEDVTILCLAHVEIGDHTCISQRSFLCTGSHDFRVSTFDLITKPISIGSHCWIAAMTFVSPGSRIPANTMISANQLVTPSWLKKQRFDCQDSQPTPHWQPHQWKPLSDA